MGKNDNARTKQIEEDIEYFKVSPEKASENMDFPDELRDSRYRRTANPRKIWYYMQLLFSMLIDSFNGKYPLPKKTIFVMTFSLLYLISPVDISPDVFPVIGVVDDIAILAFAFNFIKDDLEKYNAWKISN